MSDQKAGPPPTAPDVGADDTPRAWRLIYTYDPDGVRLVSQQRVATLAPADDSGLTAAARAGYWVELRGSDGPALYRQVIHNPFPMTLETHGPEGESRHVVASDVEGVFQVLVPDLPGASQVMLYGLLAPVGSDQPSDALAPPPTAAHRIRVDALRETPPPAVT